MSKITKIGVGIVAFEGTEHIKNTAYEFRRCGFDTEIVVCLQTKSYTGVDVDQYDIDEVERCKAAGLVDKIIWYSFDEKDIAKAKKHETKPGDWPRILECNKRNMILDELEKDGCTQAIVTDSDEYYDSRELRNVLKYYDLTDSMRVSYCRYLNYWQDYFHYLVWDKYVYVPFVSDIKYRFKFGAGLGERAVDMTRSYGLDAGETYNIVNWESLKMHHFSWIRMDIEKKINSWSSQKYYNNETLDYIKKKYYEWKPWENAYVTYRIPLKPVCVEKYEHAYIHPHYALYEKP